MLIMLQNHSQSVSMVTFMVIPSQPASCAADDCNDVMVSKVDPAGPILAGTIQALIPVHAADNVSLQGLLTTDAPCCSASCRWQ